MLDFVVLFQIMFKNILHASYAVLFWLVLIQTSWCVPFKDSKTEMKFQFDEMTGSGTGDADDRGSFFSYMDFEDRLPKSERVSYMFVPKNSILGNILNAILNTQK